MKTESEKSNYMNHKFSKLGITLSFAGLLFISLVAAKCKRECEDIICEPCPNSRLRVEYVDINGNCMTGFENTAMIYALNSKNPLDTLYSYTISDSCTAAYIIQEDVIYHLVAGSFGDTIAFGNWEYQAGIPVTECCLCYPVDHADVYFNGDSTFVEWADSSYENVPVTRVVQ